MLVPFAYLTFMFFTQNAYDGRGLRPFEEFINEHPSHLDAFSDYGLLN